MIISTTGLGLISMLLGVVVIIALTFKLFIKSLRDWFKGTMFEKVLNFFSTKKIDKGAFIFDVNKLKQICREEKNVEGYEALDRKQREENLKYIEMKTKDNEIVEVEGFSDGEDSKLEEYMGSDRAKYIDEVEADRLIELEVA